MAGLSLDILGQIVDGIAEEFEKRPPTLGVVGVSGVGKSSTINALFRTSLPTSPTLRGTSRFTPQHIAIDGRKVMRRGVAAALKVYDSVGLGEDMEADPGYLRRYREHLGKCDCVLWVTSARNRAVALDQSYMAELKAHLPHLVVGLNQADLVEPMNWSARYNIPSVEQERHLAEIAADRRERYARALGRAAEELPVISYCAKRRHNLSQLFLQCLTTVPSSRRWMFQIVKGFTARDWLDLAEGLSAEERAALEAKFATKADGLDVWGMLKSRLSGK
ncbi:MAG: GTPase [Pseudomonadota bacterium]